MKKALQICAILLATTTVIAFAEPPVKPSNPSVVDKSVVKYEEWTGTKSEAIKKMRKDSEFLDIMSDHYSKKYDTRTKLFDGKTILEEGDMIFEILNLKDPFGLRLPSGTDNLNEVIHDILSN